MPRSVRGNIGHAAGLPDQAESHNPLQEDEIDLGVYVALRDAVTARAAAEVAIRDAVIAARAYGVSWETIGVLLGTSGEAVRQRYGQ